MANSYKPPFPQLVFPRAGHEELVTALLKQLGDDYFEYECRDFLDALGPAIQELLLKGKAVQIRNLGKFVIATNKPKDYYDVSRETYARSFGSFTVKFRMSLGIRQNVSRAIKALMISTMRIPADVMLSEKPESMKQLPTPKPNQRNKKKQTIETTEQSGKE